VRPAWNGAGRRGAAPADKLLPLVRLADVLEISRNFAHPKSGEWLSTGGRPFPIAGVSPSKTPPEVLPAEGEEGGGWRSWRSGLSRGSAPAGSNLFGIIVDETSMIWKKSSSSPYRGIWKVWPAFLDDDPGGWSVILILDSSDWRPGEAPFRRPRRRRDSGQEDEAQRSRSSHPSAFRDPPSNTAGRTLRRCPRIRCFAWNRSGLLIERMGDGNTIAYRETACPWSASTSSCRESPGLGRLKNSTCDPYTEGSSVQTPGAS